jgi:hypothetical protein
MIEDRSAERKFHCAAAECTQYGATGTAGFQGLTFASHGSGVKSITVPVFLPVQCD